MREAGTEIPEIYLDANATTAVLPRARAAALAAMADDYGNPSSGHLPGLRARACLAAVRARARRVLGVATGQVLFVSGATEGLQTAVLSALRSIAGRPGIHRLLYGATEHKAVPEALGHWNEVLGLGLEILAIPVGADGRHDLPWLRAQAATAGLVCTMAANNETGVVSDLAGIAQALEGSPALWLVDGVQALGKMPLDLAGLPVDYAVFSGHKFYAPKGIGLLYARHGAPLTPLVVGGGQEQGQRSGTENVPAIAALGAVLEALEEGGAFRDQVTLKVFRDRLAGALRDAFPGVVFNAPEDRCLPTTLNFSVPGLDSGLLLDVFDAAGLRMSGGSACSTGSGAGSPVLQAMGLPAWQVASAVRLSFGPATETTLVDEACRRIRRCGHVMREQGLVPAPELRLEPVDGVTRFVSNGACCYLLVDAQSRCCVVIDPLPELTQRLAQAIRSRELDLVALLDTHTHGDHASAAEALRQACGGPAGAGGADALGWAAGSGPLALGRFRLTRLPVPGHTRDSVAYLWFDGQGRLQAAFVGDTVLPGALGRSDFPHSDPLAYASSIVQLHQAVGDATLLLPGHDDDDRFACTFASESAAQPLLAQVLAGGLAAAAFADRKARLETDIPPTRYQTIACGVRCPSGAEPAANVVHAAGLAALLQDHPELVFVDVREAHEQRLGPWPELPWTLRREVVPLSSLTNAMPRWLESEPALLFVCRSGNRSATAARAMSRLGHRRSFSLAGGLALWPQARA